MRCLRLSAFAAAMILFPLMLLAQATSLEICGWPVKGRSPKAAAVKFRSSISGAPCQRPKGGSVVTDPEDFRSENGVLKLALTVRSSVDSDGHVRYCYLAKDGSEAPNIRVKPGDWLILSLKNEIEIPPATAANSMKMGAPGEPTPDGCTKTGMTPLSTNLHFHGLTVPPVCHQDDVLKTVVQAGDAPFEYRFQIPAEEASGAVLVSPSCSWTYKRPSAWRALPAR